MPVTLGSLRPVYVVGVGLHPYQPLSETPYVQLGLSAARDALTDARVPWEFVDSAYVAKALLPMAVGRPMLRHLGATGLPITHIENASASGSAVFRQACMEVACAMSDISFVIGVDTPTALRPRPEMLTGIPNLADNAIVPFTPFALLADAYAQQTGCSFEDIARVAVKNLRNASLNPFAQPRRAKTLDEILGGKKGSGPFSPLQCKTVGEGPAALMVASA